MASYINKHVANSTFIGISNLALGNSLINMSKTWSDMYILLSFSNMMPDF